MRKNKNKNKNKMENIILNFLVIKFGFYIISSFSKLFL